MEQALRAGHQPPKRSRAVKWIAAVGLLFASLIMLGILSEIWTPLAWLVPLLSGAIFVHSLVRPGELKLGYSPSGTRKVFGVIALITFFAAVGAVAGKEAEIKAQRIVAAGKGDPARQAALLAAADTGTLAALKRISPELERQEQQRRESVQKAEQAAKVVAAAADAKRAQKAAVADAAAKEAANKSRIATIVRQEKSLDPDDLDARLAAFTQLVELAPNNPSYAEKLTILQGQIDRRAEIKENPEKGAELINYNWSKGGFGAVMILNVTIRNVSTVPLKDFEINCVHSAPSGTEIDSNKRTVYELIAPGKTRRVRQINMGLIASQAARTSCEIVGATVAA